jgi:GDP-L-fucose synthase
MKALVTGATGLLGSEIVKLSNDFIGVSSSDINLLNDNFLDVMPNDVDVVIHCAAKVGGVKANTEFVSDFFQENMKMNMNIINACHEKKVKLVSILSTCIYPDRDYVKYPLTEDQLHSGPPHHSNFGYAYAKRMLDVQTRAFRKQYGSNFITVIPNNLYGKNDNYNLDSGHVIPSLVRKFYEAKKFNNNVSIWGTGTPLREFTLAEDAAKIIIWLARNYNEERPVNIGNTEQFSIKDVVEKISNIFEFRNEIIFDNSKPDGQFMKPSSNEYLKSLGWDENYTNIEDGLRKTIFHFIERYPNVRGI